LLLVEDATGISAEELLAEAERLQAPAGLRHRKIQVLGGGDGLADGLTAAGWTAETIVVMALHRPDARGDTPHAEVRETGFGAVRPLMEAWYRESMGECEARDLADSDADSATRSGARYFLAERNHEPAASCELLGFD